MTDLTDDQDEKKPEPEGEVIDLGQETPLEIEPAPTLKEPSESDRLRQRVKQSFIEATGAPGSLLSAELTATLLGIDTRTAYRWMRNPLFMPPLRVAESIEEFAHDVKALRAELDIFVRFWIGTSIFRGGVLGRLIFKPGVLRVLDDPKSTIQERREEALAKILLQHVRETREREKLRDLKRLAKKSQSNEEEG